MRTRGSAKTLAICLSSVRCVEEWKTELHDEGKLPHPGFCAAWPRRGWFCLGRCGWPGLTLECRQNFVRNSTRNKSWLWAGGRHGRINVIGASLYVMEILCSLCRPGDSHVSLSASWKWWLIIVNEGASSLCCYTCVS